MWMVDMNQMADLEKSEEEQDRKCQWNLVEFNQTSASPGALAHHSSVVFGDKMYLYGGSNLYKENKELYSLDMRSFKWEILKGRGDVPLYRDEHTAIIYDH